MRLRPPPGRRNCDLERFGIHMVASPRHADVLLVTGPVTRNMETALGRTYEAAPDPRVEMDIREARVPAAASENVPIRSGNDTR